MGYRNTSDDERAIIGLSTEFEWDGGRWLFRRGGRAAPVEVTREEMIQSVSVYENLTIGVIALLVAGGLFGTLAMGTGFDPGGGDDSDVSALLIFGGIIVVLFAVLSIARRFATRRFKRRTPLGPPRSRMELRRARVEQTSWFDLLWPVAFFGLMASLHFPPIRSIDWLWIGLVLFVAGAKAFDAMLKWRARPTKARAPA